MDAEAVEATLTTAAGECVLIPISCNSNHWCSIMIDIAKRTVYIYVSMQSSYLSSVRRVVAEKLTPMLATSTGKDFAYRRTNRTWQSSWTTTTVACLSFLLLSTSQVHHRSGEWTRS
ncbi:Ulp1 protease family, C-terminal catalytic domain [Phytophthora cactorum]|nr:Ulp1 protease family, C-terminal catalytic domain [Phytophthora cactorum]